MAGDRMHTGNNAAASEHFCELAKLAGDMLKERLAQDPEYTNQESELAPVPFLPIEIRCRLHSW